MANALLGYTGFVGATLHTQTTFDDHYNSANIARIEGKIYDFVVCAAAPGAKWKANQEPQADLSNLVKLMAHLRRVKVREFILISTVDVYRMPPAVNENTRIDAVRLDAYGHHRFLLEAFVRQNFERLVIVRLPGLFGEGLRKNFIYDMIHTGESPWTHAESVFQFYNMANLWRDLQTVRASGLSLVNFATQPVSAGDVAQRSFDLTYTHRTEKPPVFYDMRSIHAEIFGSKTPYMASADEIFAQIRAFAQAGRARSA